jgi:CheY-like chemotaxis protein
MLPPSHSYNLLIIDDSPSDMRLMAEASKQSGLKAVAEIHYATGGREGLDILEAAQRENKVFELVLLDLNMPKIGGRDVLARIKKDKRFNKMPVFIMTNSDLKSDIEDCYALGADAYFQKPADFSQLIGFFVAVKYSLEVKNCISLPHISVGYKELKVAV